MRTRTVIGLVLLSLATTACSAGESDPHNDIDVRLNISEQASAAELGLPDYPGSRPYKDEDSTSSAADIGLSTPWFGFKVVAKQLQSADEPERIAAFYRRALAKYGTVLDCSRRAAGGTESGSAAQDGHELTCDATDAESRGFVFKAGTEEQQRIVTVTPHAGGTRFSLVHLDMTGRSGK